MKYIVMYHRPSSTFSKQFQLFEENQEVEMKSFIDIKVLSGMTCHIYDHRSTFKLNKTVEAV